MNENLRLQVIEGLTLPDGRRFGDAMTDAQRRDFEALTSTRFRHGLLERGRGGSKTADCAAFAITELLAGPHGGRLYACAVDQDQAGLLRDAAVGWIRRSGALAEHLVVSRWEIAYPRNDSLLKVLSSDTASSWGLGPTAVFFDELSQLPAGLEDFYQAMWSALPKRRGRMIVLQTPGWDRTSLAWRVRTMAMQSPSWYVSVQPGPAPWLDPADLDEQRQSLPEHVYRRLFLAEWVSGAGAFLSEAEVNAVFSEELPVGGGAAAIGCDLGVSRDAAVLAQVRADPSGSVVVDRLLVHTPRRAEKVDLMDVEDDLVALASAAHATVVVDPWNAALLSQRLRQRGIRVEEYVFTRESRHRLFTTLLDLVRNGRLRSRPHDRLRHELLGLEVTEAASGWRVGHRRSGSDDATVAVALGAQQVAGAGALSDAAVIVGPSREHVAAAWTARVEREKTPWDSDDSYVIGIGRDW